MFGDKEAILQDIDRLGIGYQIKLYATKKVDWQQYFHVLSLDSHQNDQLFLNCQPSITFSGLALSKEFTIKQISFLGKKSYFSGKLGFLSSKLAQRLIKIKGSSNSRWKCWVNINDKDQDFDLIITLDNGQKNHFGKIKIHPLKFRELGVNELKKPNNKQIIHKLNLIQKSRKIMAENLSKNKNYLFAIGNARSGTTALGKLLNFSPEICLGIERYGKEDDISAMSFEKENFFDVNSKGYSVRPHFYETIREKFDTAKYVGDKRPRFIESWKNTFLNLPQAKIVYIFRNIYDVACSYNVRASNAAQGLDKQWRTNRDFSEAVHDWNEGIQEIQNLARFYKVYFVKYEDFFVHRSKMIHLFNYLGVNPEEPKTKVGIEKTYKTALSVQKKARILADHEKEYIDANADFEAYNKLLFLYEKEFK
ncbi:MAG: sulfotransferase [Xenococcaceae cyanobacterium MO_167.B27]|nr:sulfotransferase [Xenococcaceae cyanobacterium MO_167.B27]